MAKSKKKNVKQTLRLERTSKDLARVLGISEGACRSWLRKEGLGVGIGGRYKFSETEAKRIIRRLQAEHGDMKIAVYPGSFDPVTCGHLDVIERAANVFDKVIVAVLENSDKKHFFSTKARADMIKRLELPPNVEVGIFGGLLVDFMKKHGAKILIKGLRAVSDYEYECQMAWINNKLMPECDTFFVPTSEEYAYLSSSIVREIAKFNGDLTGLAPKELHETIYGGLNGRCRTN